MSFFISLKIWLFWLGTACYFSCWFEIVGFVFSVDIPSLPCALCFVLDPRSDWKKQFKKLWPSAPIYFFQIKALALHTTPNLKSLEFLAQNTKQSCLLATTYLYQNSSSLQYIAVPCLQPLASNLLTIHSVHIWFLQPSCPILPITNAIHSSPWSMSIVLRVLCHQPLSFLYLIHALEKRDNISLTNQWWN